MTMTDAEARRRTVVALERIADALEKANASDPLQALERALAETGDRATPEDASHSLPGVPLGVAPDDAWRFR